MRARKVFSLGPAAKAALTALVFCLGYTPVVVHAQDAAQVVNSCGTPLGTLALGQVAVISQNAQGQLCISGSFSATFGLTTAGGWTRKALIGLSATPVLIKASAGQIGKLQCWNSNAAVAYIQTYDSAAPTVGTTPSVPIMIAPNQTGGFTLSLIGDQFSTAISLASTTTAGGTTGQPVDCSVSYN